MQRTQAGRPSLQPTVQQQAVVTAVLSSQESVQRVIKSFHGVDGSLGPGGLPWLRKMAHDKLYAEASKQTPYGPVCSHTDVHGRAGSVKFFHVNPFAMLSSACMTSSAFANFLGGLIQAAPDNTLELIFYLDKATPGSLRRPDAGRGAQCVYLSLIHI